SASQHSGLFVEELLKIDPQFRDPEQEDPAYSEWFKEVLLKIYQDDGQAFRTYRLLDGHIKNYRALFSSFYPIQDDNNHIIYIEFASATQIINDSTKNQFEWYITPFKPKEYQPAVKAFEGEEDFEVSIQLKKGQQAFVPMGIPDFNGKKENEHIAFQVHIEKNAIDSFDIEIWHDNKVIKRYYSQNRALDEVVITAKGNGNPSTTDQQTSSSGNYPTGKYSIKWDGFDSDGIYDSSRFTNGELKARIIGKRKGKEKRAETKPFSFKYAQVPWVDCKINAHTKRIDVKLRVHLRDGGEQGTDKDCKTMGAARHAPIKTICPWDKIPEEVIKNTGKEPIKTRTKSFKQLKQLALDGVSKYWSRHKGNIGKGVEIDGELYEFFVGAVYDEAGMVAPKIVFLTNFEESDFTRSHNWVASRKLFYKVGYILNGNWFYQLGAITYHNFIETSAHEIGHQLISELDGKYQSYTHKGTSHWSMIMQIPVEGTKYPIEGEIDLMKYADDYKPINYLERVVLSENECLGVLWLTKIEITS
ncbi:MAG: hypothetical protein OIF50_04265, partial [Flavobacteriaceae bacterium]|nr:hypothetical protein [Flavobacteriaceae bacterium]